MTPAPASGAHDSTRCFIALIPDSASRAALQACRGGAPANVTRGLRWVDAAALHLTLRFFGAASSAQVDYLKHMLPALACAMPAIAARRCAIWPNRARPRLLVLELDAPAVLRELAGECEALARKAGFDAEARAFRAHLTLARLRPACLPEPPAVPAGAIRFESLALLASDLQAGGARYRELASVALRMPART